MSNIYTFVSLTALKTFCNINKCILSIKTEMILSNCVAVIYLCQLINKSPNVEANASNFYRSSKYL